MDPTDVVGSMPTVLSTRALPDRAASQTVVMDPTDVLDPSLQSSRHAHCPIEQRRRLWSWIQRRPLDPCLQSSRHAHCPIEQRRRLWSWIQRTSLDPCLQSSQHAHCPIEQRRAAQTVVMDPTDVVGSMTTVLLPSNVHLRFRGCYLIRVIVLHNAWS